MTVAAILAVSLALPQAEFAKYHEMITGRIPGEKALALEIDPSVSKTGNDAYSIKSAGTGAKITGSNLRSVFYGVYDLLERRGGCRWFWDGDIVPKHAAIDLSGLDVEEEARFEFRAIRYFAHRGLTRFQAEHWGPDEWRREIDWCLKRRLNVFMPRIGQDDLFQRAFPETVPYPDASRDLPGHGKGYDNRTLFWSLEFRGRLRKTLQEYAFARGLEIPEDFGTMTHWYSRTPEEFLEKMNPPFLPQATEGYSERNGRVWDVRDPKWADAYWHLTETAVREYGRPGLLHTIGLGERNCSTNRAENLKMKIDTLHAFLSRAHSHYPQSRVLLAGWDFYFTWFPDEVRALVDTLDPKRDVIWDYEGDATRDYRPEMAGLGNNFTKWGVQGRFPYTFSIFLAFEDALDIRANYPVIEERQKSVQNDPFCAGYILWPEASHTDTLLLRFFAANAWKRGGESIGAVLDEFCASRYGEDATRWKDVWRATLPLARLADWGGNYGRHVTAHPQKDDPYNDAARWANKRIPVQLAAVPGIMRTLAGFDWKKTPFTERDAIDIARTAADRTIVAARDDLLRSWHAWRAGSGTASETLRKADTFAAMGGIMADILALHTDYSLAESFERLNAVEHVANPDFPKVLVENATCHYCASHHAESAAFWYAPAMREFAETLARKTAQGDRSPIPRQPDFDEYRDAHMLARPLREMRPSLPRTQGNFAKTLEAFASAAEKFAGR